LENYLDFSSPFLSRKEMNGSINEWVIVETGGKKS